MANSAPLIRGLDHVYLAVSDMTRAEAYYDRVFAALGFRKGTRAIAGQRHAHYLLPNLQITLRPSRGPRTHDPYAPGLHHLCLQATSREAVDACFAKLIEAGADPTPPRLYPEYNPEYYATFFEDPDGIRLELVARTGARELLARRWDELEVFENPLLDLEGKELGIFHITTIADWEEGKQLGTYIAPSLQTEGFIHCSMRSQVVQSANNYFRGHTDLVLLHIDPRKLDVELRYEPPRTMSDGIYPHLYGPLNVAAVVAVYELPAADGSFRLPELRPLAD